MPSAIALFSGGLDSMLAARLIMEQGISVTAIQFASPFFNYKFLQDPDARVQEIKEKFGIAAEIHDISGQYLKLLRAPCHGFGKNFNPCIDCKIFLLSKAKQIMEQRGASFLVTGEVIGQRPMSQRRDTLNVIQRESNCAEILVRPLCAQLLPPTRPEIEGILDREKLLAFSGRGRSQQIALAARMGISGYPSPAGGCILTDPILAARIRIYYEELEQKDAPPDLEDVLLLLKGRHFRLPGGTWLIMGRNETENQKVARIQKQNDSLLYAPDFIGPTGLLRTPAHTAPDINDIKEDTLLAASLLAGYARRPPETASMDIRVEGKRPETVTVAPLCSPDIRKQYQPD